MKKVFTIIIVILVVTVVVVVLLMNKAKQEAKLKTASIQSAFPVLVYEVKIEKLSDTLELVGTINPFNEITVASETTGRINGVYFDVGSRVSPGKILISVDDEVKRAALASAQANFDKASKDLERYSVLLEQKSITEAQYEAAKLTFAQTESQLQIAERQLRDTKITSSVSGIVTEKKIDKGSYVAQGTPVATIVNIDKLKVKVNVPEKDAFLLREGVEVELTTDVYPGIKFYGKILNINSKADEAHNYPVEIVLSNNKSNPLRAGMFMRVYFSNLGSVETISVPRAALVGSIKNPKVFVVSDSIVVSRDIIVGREIGEKLEILDGLKQGDVVVTNGQINLKDSTKIKIVNE